MKTIVIIVLGFTLFEANASYLVPFITFKNGTVAYYDTDSVNKTKEVIEVWTEMVGSDKYIKENKLRFNLVKDHYQLDCTNELFEIDYEYLINGSKIIYQGKPDASNDLKKIKANSFEERLKKAVCH